MALLKIRWLANFDASKNQFFSRKRHKKNAKLFPKMSQCKPESTSKSAIRKVVVRNTEIPVNRTKAHVVFHPNTSVKATDGKTIKGTLNFDFGKREKSNSNKFKCPELNTTLEVAKTIRKIEEVRSFRLKSTAELTPQSKGIVAHEVTKKLNFPPDKSVFKNLTPINVNDSILLPEVRKPFRKKYVPKPSKDPVPELSDFLTPVEPLELVVPLYKRMHPPKMPKFNCFDSIYELHLNFHPDEMP